jgi:hypothetical protein
MQNTSARKILIYKFLKTAGISGAIFLGSLIILLFALAFVFQEKIQQIFLENINRNLKTSVQVQKVNLDLLRHFPSASLSFSNTVISEPSSDELLARANRIYLQFSPWDIIRKNYTVKKIELSGAIIKPRIDADGKVNYIIWETSENHTGSNFSLSVKKILLNQVQLEFDDFLTGTRIFINAEKATISGNFSAESFELNARGSFFINQLAFDHSPFISNKPLEADIDMLVSNMSEFTFRKANLRLNNHAFSLHGDINTTSNGMYLNTSIQGNKLDLQTLIADLPQQFREYFKGYQSKGKLTFNAQLKGYYSAQQNPHIESAFNISNASLNHRQSGLNLNQLSFSGTFDNGRNNNLSTSTLSITNFTTSINKGFLKGNLSLYNFHKPDIDLNFSTHAAASDLASLLMLRDIHSAKGELSADIAFKGRMSERNRFSSADLVRATASGSIIIRDLGFALRGKPLDYKDFNGSFLFRNNDLVIEEFSGLVSSSDFLLRGTFRNVLPYLLLENQKLFIDASLHSRLLDFDELFQLESSDTETTYNLSFSDNLGFNLRARVAHLKFRKFQATDLSGNAALNSKKFDATNLSFNSMDGMVSAYIWIDGSRKGEFLIGCEADLKNVDLNQMFYQMGNFGQAAIIDENIFGIMTSRISFKSRWSPSLDVDFGSIETTADIRVENGALVNYQPMIALSRFLRVGDLNHVKFSTLENQIHIRERNIIIPEMEIKSSALNLKITGNHTFENNIDYRLQVLLSDILSRRNRESRNPQEQYGDIIDDGYGRTTLFLAVTGNIDDPVFRYDYRGVREKIQTDMRRERQNLREAFQREFSNPEQKGVEPTAAQKQTKTIRKQEKGEFVIEWDD